MRSIAGNIEHSITAPICCTIPSTIQLKPDNHQARNNLANLYFESGFYSRSIRHFKKVLEIDAHSAPDLANIALAYYQQEKFDLAYQFLIQAENNGYEALPKLEEDMLSKVGRR